MESKRQPTHSRWWQKPVVSETQSAEAATHRRRPDAATSPAASTGENRTRDLLRTVSRRDRPYSTPPDAASVWDAGAARRTTAKRTTENHPTAESPGTRAPPRHTSATPTSGRRLAGRSVLCQAPRWDRGPQRQGENTRHAGTAAAAGKHRGEPGRQPVWAGQWRRLRAAAEASSADMWVPIVEVPGRGQRRGDMAAVAGRRSGQTAAEGWSGSERRGSV